MPAYDYKCPWCGHIKEVTHSMLSEDPIKCNNEGCEAVMEKMISKSTAINTRFRMDGTRFNFSE